MTKKVVIDNALFPDIFEKVQTHIMGLHYPWHFAEGVAEQYNSGDFQFEHKIHEWYHIDNAHDYQIVYPIIEILKPQLIVRIKANLLTKTSAVDIHGMHVDTIIPGALTAIYYCNTNNGYTIFADGDKVESVANRLVIFPANIKHSGTSCTDKLRRIVINLNYIPWRNDKTWHALMSNEDTAYRNYWEKDLNLPVDQYGCPIADDDRS
tara:strand:+ start:330 stop:953 length:624 start_codon:yes stop_codon:yes gene_type:complete